jgi:hypothetical protein
MLAHFTPSGSVAALAALTMAALSNSRQPSGIIVFGCADNEIDEQAAETFFRTIDVPIGGGLFPAIFHEQMVHHQGWLVYAIHGQISMTCSTEISVNARSRPAPAAGSANSGNDTCLVIVDGHARSISSFLASVFESSSITTKFFGGGAGSLPDPEKPCIISNNGLMRDAAIVIRLESPCGIGVSHGWRTEPQAMRATATDGNIVQELDYRPASEVYSEAVQSVFGKQIDLNDLIGTASMFPLGIRRLGGALVVRDPIAVNTAGGLICVGEFDQGCFVYLLSSELESLLAASSEATRLADIDLKTQTRSRVVFDCISRFLLLKDDFNQELAMFSESHVPVSGVLSIGEVASNSDGFLDFYNKTTAVASFTED